MSWRGFSQFRRWRVLVLTLVAVAALTLPAASLEPWRMVVRVKGRVESQRGGQQTWDPIFRSRVLSDGDFARTRDDSRAFIRLADGSQFTVGAATQVEMTRFTLTPEGRTVVFNLLLGRVRARVAKSFGSEGRFEVRTPNGVLAAHGTEFYVDHVTDESAPPTSGSSLLACAGGPVADAGGSPRGLTNFIVYDGIVEVIAGRHTHRFYPGDFGSIRPDGRILVNPPGFGLFSSLAGPDADLHPGPRFGQFTPRPVVDFMPSGPGSVPGAPPLLPGDVQSRVLQSTGTIPQAGPGTTGTIQIHVR